MESRDPALRSDELLAQVGWVRALARRLVADPEVTDDVLQQVCLLALQQAPREAQEGPRLRAWLATVTRTLVRNTARADRRRLLREQAVARPEAAHPATDDVAARREALRSLVEAVASLEEPYFSAIVDRYFNGLSVARIAAKQGITAAAVRQQLSRARHQLRSRLRTLLADDRRAWIVALLPLAPVSASLKGAPAKPLLGYLGGLLVAKSVGTGGIAKLLAALCLLALVFVGSWYAVHESSAAEPPTSPASGAGTTLAIGEPGDTRAPLPQAPVSEVSPLVPPTAAADPVVATDASPRVASGQPAIGWPQTFRVVVVDSHAQPVADARLELWTITKKAALGTLAEVESELEQVHMSDALGRGSVRLEHKDQFVLASKEGVGHSARLTSSHLSRALNGDGQSVIALQPDVIVEGHVLQANGTPAYGIAVEAEASGFVMSMSSNRHVEHAVTAPDGGFRIALLPARGITLAAIAEDGTRIEQTFEVPEDRHLSVTLRLPGDWWIDGTVLDEAGVAVPNAQVAVFHGEAIADAWLHQPEGSPEPSQSNIKADGEGNFHYRVTALEPHVLIAVAQRPAAMSEPILVQLDEAMTHASVTLEFLAPAVISGRVRDEQGAPLAGAVVAARVAGLPLLKLVQPRTNPFQFGLGVGATAATGTLGEFTLSPLHPRGSFDILLSPPSGKIFGAAMLVAQENVPAGTTGLDLVARFTGEQTRTGAIELQVYASATGLPVEVRVYTYALEGKVAGFESGAPRDNGGLVRIENLVAGSAYTVALTVNDLSAVDIHDLVASETPELVRVAVPSPGELEVEANDAQGLPLPLVEVSVRRTYEPIGFRHAAPVFTDAQGRAHFGPLDPGRFRVSFSVDGVETEAFIEVGDGAAEFLRVTAKAKD